MLLVLINAVNAFLNTIRMESIDVIDFNSYKNNIEKPIEMPIMVTGRVAMIFDTETAGLIPKQEYGTNNNPLEKMPYIIQLSYVLWDIDNNILLEKYNQYINIPADIEISEKITEITGITREMCDFKGIHISCALNNFLRALKMSDIVVAHNIAFDKQMIQFEIRRNIDNLYKDLRDISSDYNNDLSLFCKSNNKEMVCTMMDTIDLCSINLVSRYGKPYNKYPTLGELYNKLFGYLVKNLHNSIVDVFVCLRCYLKYKHSINMDLAEFNEYIRDGVVGCNN